jgi:XTP/dITP diphosphohydrolase
MKRITIFYATRSRFKREELETVSSEIQYKDQGGLFRQIGSLIDFRISDIPTDEPLEIDLEKMVRHKVRSAYSRLLAPCIVEHAGLVFDAHAPTGFPGGLTQPMWDALTVDEFLSRTGSAGEGAVARAVVGFCDGMRIRTFIGETHGTLAKSPRGSRDFYWDTIFCPDLGGGKTYAEIAECANGLQRKLLISQSAKALSQFAAFLAAQDDSGLFDMH